MRVTRSFARDHGLVLPDGYDTSRQVGQISLYEQEQSRQTGLSREVHIRAVTEAWQQCDDSRAFVQALAERGYILATGKRPYVVVDVYGTLKTALPGCAAVTRQPRSFPPFTSSPRKRAKGTMLPSTLACSSAAMYSSRRPTGTTVHG